MKNTGNADSICVFTRDDFFRPNEKVYIHMSNEFPDYIGVIHKHLFIEMVYIISGTATHVVLDKRYPAKKGDLFIINFDTPHAFFSDDRASEPFVAYDLMFTPDFLDQSITGSDTLEALNSSFLFYSLFHEKNQFTPDVSVSGNSYNKFGELFNKIYLEHRGREKGYLEIIRAYLMELIITIFRKTDSSSKKAEISRNDKAVSFALEYIRDNFDKRISVQNLANRVYLCQDYFSRLFHDVTGMTVTSMIQKVRVEHACHLLSTTNRTVADISSACGFDDVKFFYTVFKKSMNLLPGEYRKRASNETILYDEKKT